MNQEIKDKIKIDYLRFGNTRDAFRENRIYYRRYETEINKDPIFHREMKEIHELIKMRVKVRKLLRKSKPNKKFDEELFIKLLDKHHNITEACNEMQVWTQVYYEHKKKNSEFSERVNDMLSDIRADRYHARRIKRIPVIHLWTPPNQDLITYPRWRG